jgi:hypothetical protein
VSAAAKQLRALALDFQQAGSEIFQQADQVVHGVAQTAEREVRAIDGSPESVVTSYPGVGVAAIHGTEAAGVANQNTPLQAMASVDTGEMADTMTGGLLDAGVQLLMGGKR